MTDETKKVAANYARGAMGGLLIGVPVFLTMEIWWGGFVVPPWRLLLLLAVMMSVILILQRYSGTTHRKGLRAEARAAVVTLGIGIVMSAIALAALGVLHGDLTMTDVAGKLLLQSVPVSIGASVAMSAFGDDHEIVEERRKRAGYWGALGMALGGAMLFGFGISGTEELLMIADQLTWSRAIGIVVLSLVQVHAIVYAVDMKQRPEDVGTRRHALEVVREGISTYALSVIGGAYLLWTFGTLQEASGLVASIYAIVAMGFVTSLGAGAAELLI